VKRIERKDIAIDRWDALVNQSSSAQIFDTSTYLDAVAENWCVLVDDAYTKGIALPYTKRLGVETLYTPIFLRNVTLMGISLTLEALESMLKQEFKVGQLAISIQSNNSGYRHQLIDFQEEIIQSSLGKRMLKRFDKNSFTVRFGQSTKIIEGYIKQELPKKIDALNTKTLQSLQQLVESFSTKNNLHVLEVIKDNEVVGGLFLLESNKRMLYLKGAFTEASKKEGAMYGAMQQAIELANSKGLIFDFGGSRVEGVRRFNINLGGKDQFYTFLSWDNAPFWFNWIKKLAIWMKK
jgi:hypothetical protein